MSLTKFVPHLMKVSIIRVTSYESKIIQGILSNPFFGEEKPFYGMIQLILLLEALQDDLNYPEQGMRSRSFSKSDKLDPPPPGDDPANTEPGVPALATFKTSVYFRQNASWQGSIFWEEEQSTANFRSVLELIKLIDDALS